MKKNKKYAVLLLMFITLIFSGCNPTTDASFDKFTVNGSEVSKNGDRYEITSNLNNIKAYINVKDNVGSYKLRQVEYNKEGYNGPTTDYVCYSPSGNNPYEELKNIKADKEYHLTYEIYATDDCSVSTSEDDLGELTVRLYTYTESSSNVGYISVENINQKLGNWDYVNMSNGTEVSCASYGIEDKEENIPLCIALAVKGSHDSFASDCAGFLKKVYNKVDINISSIYSYGTKKGNDYYSSTSTPPSGIKDGDHIVMYTNGGSYAHIAMVFYWDAKKEWYTVNGNWGQSTGNPYVEVVSLEDMIDQTSWGYYHFRSV